MKTLLLSLACVLLCASPVLAQQDPCATAQPPFAVTSGAPFGVTFLEPTTAPASPTDPTPVPVRIDGFHFQIDTGVKQSVVLSPGAACPSGSFVGLRPYTYRTASGVSKGSHTLTIIPWNFVLDPVTGDPTTTKQEGIAVQIPFAAIDPVQAGPPPPVVNAIIKR